MLPDINEIAKTVSFKTSRSGGKGGQNVNKVSTKVELIFNIDDAYFLNDDEKDRLKVRLVGRLDTEGLLHIISQEDRSQLLNKQRSILKLLSILKSGLSVQKPRKATKISKSTQEKRRLAKTQHAQKKANRAKLNGWD
jgi:ribosome-associated protein